MLCENKTTLYRINILKKILKKEELDGYIQPRADSFLGEYVPTSSARLEWLSGFSGSAGEFLILMNKSILFVDSRYTIQAQNETKGTNIKIYLYSNSSLQKWFQNNKIQKKLKIALDPWLYSYTQLKNLINFGNKNNIEFIKLKNNPIDLIWKLDRPIAPKTVMRKHLSKYSGIKTHTKINNISHILKLNNMDAYIISQPESLAWLLNIRGSDLEHTPIILFRAILFKNKKMLLFIDKERINFNTLKYLKSEIKTLKIFPENEIIKKISNVAKKGKNFWIDPKITPYIIAKSAHSKNNKVYKESCPIELEKSIKNNTEIRGSILSHIKDGVALCSFLYWINTTNYKKLNELKAANKIDNLRKEQNNFVSTSFPTISGFSSNGAIIHYRVSEKSNKKFTKNGIYLCDSGGQYLEGTTDVTRTIIIGQPTNQMKKDFTIVLKAHIALASSKFPKGTSGNELDILARTPLWKNNMNYGHGTGHGVGSFLSVHEGPHRISKGSFIPLQPGMITSNEPGFYKTRKYGIRIENLMLVKKDKNYKANKMLSFKTLTLAPIDVKLIDANLLNKEETIWINNYHSKVYSEISNKVALNVKKWLKKACKRI
tara:strand:+ start:8156 stop:9958 length:1803 start_codon:yes stop_codon:yes gene_type:complete